MNMYINKYVYMYVDSNRSIMYDICEINIDMYINTFTAVCDKFP
jgi:hypothetical protein